MIDFTKIKSKKIWRIYNSNGTPQGYFLNDEKMLAESYARSINGSIHSEYIYYYA